MVSVGMFEAKTRFSSLVADVVAGRTDCVRVMRRGVPVVRIVVDGGSRDASRRIGVRRALRLDDRLRRLIRKVRRHVFDRDCRIGVTGRGSFGSVTGTSYQCSPRYIRSLCS